MSSPTTLPDQAAVASSTSPFNFFLSTLGASPGSVTGVTIKQKLARRASQLNADALDSQGEVDLGFKRLLAHAVLGTDPFGVSQEKLSAIWQFQTSPLYTDAERLAIDFALTISARPEAVTDTQYLELRKYWSEAQIEEIFAVVAMLRALRSWDDVMASWLNSQSRAGHPCPQQMPGRRFQLHATLAHCDRSSAYAAANERYVWEHPELVLSPRGRWSRTSAADSTHTELYCEDLQARIIASVVNEETPVDQLVTRAQRLIALHRRVKSPERGYTIQNERIVALEEDCSVELSYTGQREGISTFGFFGFVSTRKIVSVLCDAKLSFAPGRVKTLQMIVDGFKVRLP